MTDNNCADTSQYAVATPEERIEAIKFWYDGWLCDSHSSADTILCQQVGQILGLPIKQGL